MCLEIETQNDAEVDSVYILSDFPLRGLHLPFISSYAMYFKVSNAQNGKQFVPILANTLWYIQQ